VKSLQFNQDLPSARQSSWQRGEEVRNLSLGPSLSYPTTRNITLHRTIYSSLSKDNCKDRRNSYQQPLPHHNVTITGFFRVTQYLSLDEVPTDKTSIYFVGKYCISASVWYHIIGAITPYKLTTW